MAREAFGVENVVARIYDPRRAAVYQRLGIPTVATVGWTADAILRRMMPGDGQLASAPEWQDASGTLAMQEMPLPEVWAGSSVTELERGRGLRVVYLTRGGRILLAGVDQVLEAGDVLHVAAHGPDLEGLAERLADETERG